MRNVVHGDYKVFENLMVCQTESVFLQTPNKHSAVRDV